MSDKKEAKSAKKKRALANVQNYKDTFSTIHGKKVLRDLMRHSGMMGTNFSPESAYVTAFNEGGRSVVCYILQKLNTDITKLEEMIEQEYKEHNIFE